MLLDHFVNNENGRDFITIFFVPTNPVFSVAMINVFTSCVLFYYSINCENEWDFRNQRFHCPHKLCIAQSS